MNDTEINVPAAAVGVLDECIAETWRTLESNPDAWEADYAADIVRRLTTAYGL